MGTERAKQLINNILVEICNTSDMDKKTYYNWLTMEVGFSQQEIEDMAAENLMPFPV